MLISWKWIDYQMSAQIKVKAGWRLHMIAYMQQGHSSREAARLLNIGKSLVNAERRRDPDFAAELDEMDAARRDKKRVSC